MIADGPKRGLGVLNVGSLFSGVGGFDLGLERAGMRIAFQCEIDLRCRRILVRHWPGVPCYEDVRLVGRDDGRPARGRDRDARDRDDGAGSDIRVGVQPAWPGGGSAPGADGLSEFAREQRRQQPLLPVDLLCGGFPCQDLSVAGRRAGLAGERSGLFFEFARVADELVRPGGWILVENVPGLLSSAGGRDFAIVLRTLGDIGFHDLAWRVLDSRYFGVPQRRRRVFIAGRRAAGNGAREVLLETESGGGDFAPRRETRSRAAASLSRGTSSPGVSAPGRRQEDDENIVVNALDRRQGGADDNDAQAGHLVASALVGRYGKGTDSDATDALIAHTLRAEGFDASEDGTGRGTPLIAADQPQGDNRRTGPNAPSADEREQRRNGRTESTHRLYRAPAHPDRMRAAPIVPRRVDDPPPDGPRYAAMGNAVTVNVAEWIGRRIVNYELTSRGQLKT